MKISVIIPALNEENYIVKTIQSIQNAGKEHLLEIIVVDSMSKDKTANLALAMGCRIVQSKPGNKWMPLNAGARIARGDVLLFVDADSVMPVDYASAILRELIKNKVVGGAFEFTLKENGFTLRVIEIINRIRYRIWKNYYGDQSIFAFKKSFDKIGGFPEREILEASYFCLNLRKIGKLKLIKMPVITSARRFLEGGACRVFLHDIRIWFLDTLGFSMEKYGKAYWQKNQNRIA